VAGFCNGTIGSGSNDLGGPWGIYVSPSDGSLYVTDWDLNRYQMFPQFSRTGNTFFSSDVYQPADVFVDSFGNIYMIDGAKPNTSVRVLQAGVIVRRFPAPGLSTSSCLLNGLCGGYSIALDRSGNVYISLYSCYAVVKWAPNATVGILIAGTLGSLGWTSTTLYKPRYIHLDEDLGALYVSDAYNNRIQMFVIGGNGTGVTVAGTSYAGTALNQLDNPAGICVTRDGKTLYVADYYNHRIMKWTIGASQGSVLAGSASGISGSTNQLLSWPGDIALDATETYLYVADYGNHRVQKFRVQ
jgi:DNA-binding beta-propeller fold protein YncE